MVPPDIPEYFLPHEQNTQEYSNLIYRPVIAGAALVRFSIPKSKIDTMKEQVFLTPVSDNPISVNWDDSREVDIKVSDLQNAPAEDFPYADLPSAALKARNYSTWEKDFSKWLFRTQKIQLLRSSYLNELSKPGETERDFRVRLQQIAREKRDQQVEKLREKYALSFTRLDERVRRAQMALKEQQAQAKGQKYQVAVSLGETLLGSFLGRKSSTRATRATREIARSMKESRDRENAEANLKALQQERARLEAQFQSEVDYTEAKTNPLAEPLENVLITPTKTNITVRLVALVWTTR